MEVNKEDIVEIALQNPRYLYTKRAWDSHAKINGFPTSYTVAFHFGSWRAFQTHCLRLLREKTHSPYFKQQLLDIAYDHKDHVTTITEWNRYAKKNQLPSAFFFAKAFGSWNEFKDTLGLDIYKTTKGYTKEILLEIAHLHLDHLTSANHWQKYAVEQKLPSIHTIMTYFRSWNHFKREVELETQLRSTKRYALHELIFIAQEYRSYFTTKSHWDNYARERGLPLSHHYLHHFGSWRKFKMQYLED